MMERFRLTGPRGDNPLGFLTALGVLATLHDAGLVARLSWTELTPCIDVEVNDEVIDSHPNENRKGWLVDTIYSQLKKEALRAPENSEPDKALIPGEKNVKFGFEKYVSFVCEAREQFLKKRDSYAKRQIDLAAFYGVTGPQGEPSWERISANYWVLLEGSGHQNFFPTIIELILRIDKGNIERALYGPWEPVDERFSLRLDPVEDRRYALMDVNPSTLKSMTLWGANRLAFEAFRLFTAAPSGRNRRDSMEAIGWKRLDNGEVVVRWPLWKYPVNKDVVFSLLSHPAIWKEDWETLRGMGVFAVIQSKRVTVDKFKNMTMGMPLWMEYET